jgi:hypothetical protein
VRAYSFIRFHWQDEEDPHYYFELKMNQDELTGSFTLEITDFATPDEADDLKGLWTSQVAKMRRVLGF